MSTRHYNRPERTAYPIVRPLGAHPDHRELDRTWREAARQIRASCTTGLDAATGQQFRDTGKGRPLGALAIAKLLVGAKMAGASRTMALQLTRALEGFTVALYGAGTRCLRTAMVCETAAQGDADLAHLKALTSDCVAVLDEAIEKTDAHITALTDCRAALLIKRGQLS